ncbi:putative G3BP-like protein [Prunus yedoensis var. nudiflora]|uniref:Putative G3BP-like protein n=1 Tax=Prunus yedoensis var. nudiflora TaxID=2094558 RepID=A0A314ZGN4_PRUYE|nr:putative G3BP-like protein [Prunus yedoensis var. nudiflora]
MELHTSATVEQSNSALSFVPESGAEAAEEGYALEEEGELKSVYVRNLPPTVTEDEIEQEFKNFGQIKPDGVFVRARKEIGVCYAFVEFEDLLGVHNALKASPIQLAGRQVYIEERRPNSTGAARGRGRGRGRGSYQPEATRGRFGGRSSGRGSYQDGGDYSRARGNGFQQRGTR